MNVITAPSISSVSEAVARNRQVLQSTIDAIRLSGQEVPAPEPEHEFSCGIYGRKLLLPAGVLVVSKIHIRGGFVAVLRGDVSIFHVSGGVTRHRTGDVAPYPGGTQRAVFAHEESLVMTFQATEQTDPAAAEDELTALTWDRVDRADAWAVAERIAT